MEMETRDLCCLDIELYKCISKDIDTEKVVLTDKAIVHIAEHHPDAYLEVLPRLKETIQKPEYIIKDKKHENTGLVVKKLSENEDSDEHAFVVLKVCVDSHRGQLANSVISGWIISGKRLDSYLRNSQILYKKE